jgi:hypothetical protein
MGLKVRKKKSLIFLSLKFLKNCIYKETYYKNKINKTRIKQKINLRQKNYLAIENKQKKTKHKKRKKLNLLWLESLLLQTLISSLQNRREEGSTN